MRGLNLRSKQLLAQVFIAQAAIKCIVTKYHFLLWVLALSILCSAPSRAQPAGEKQEHANFFNDPFVQVTQGIANCPVPPGPRLTQAERLKETHYRAERGTSCFMAGRCRLPSAYLYDAEIIPRVVKAIETDGRFTGASVWVLGQRRWVWLQGCVRTLQDMQELEQLVRRIDDVEAVINELVVRAK
jgi:hypothetical protein